MKHLTAAQVREALGVSHATLARRVAESLSAGIPIPRVPVGPRTYRWRDLAQVERWLEELHTWQASTSGARAGGSTGATSAVSPERGHAPTRPPRVPSPATSSSSSPSGATGSLRDLARSLHLSSR